jgi:hypothetical protein
MRVLDPSEDALVANAPAGADSAFFDRFYFNVHGSRATPLVMVGAGVYPRAGLMDGYLIVVDGNTQSNLRFSEETAPASTVGPLSWSVQKPLQRWRLQVAPNPLGLELDVTWTARTAPWRTEDIKVDNGRGGSSNFGHFFQSGTYAGTLTWAGETLRIDGWLGQRDRSRGVRVVAGGQGLHLWVQAQFADRSIAFIMDETRGHEMYLCDGAVLHTNGTCDQIVGLEHDLEFDEGLDFHRGTLRITTESGQTFDLAVDGTAGGGFLSGGGYGGWHGKPHGPHHMELDEFALDGSVTPRNLDMPLTDRPATFELDGEVGAGVFEFAHTRSSSYNYAKSLQS